MKKILIIGAIIIVAYAIFVFGQQKEGDFGAARSPYNITVNECEHSTTTATASSTLAFARNPNATTTYRGVCNDDLGESSPNSSVILQVQNATTVVERETGFVIDQGECKDFYPSTWLPISPIYIYATTGSSTVALIECGN